MKGYKFAKKELESNSTLKSQAEQLLELFLAAPTTEFEISKLSFDFSLLKESGELKDWSADRLKLEGGDAFFCLWFEDLKRNFSFELSNDYNSITLFLESVENNYREQKLHGGLYSLLNRLEQWLMVTLNQEFGSDFYDDALRIKREDRKRSVYDFSKNFGHALPFLKISADRLLPILVHLKNEMSVEGRVDAVEGYLRVGLKDLVKNQIDFGKELLNYFSSMENTKEYESLTLSGLIEGGRVEYLNKIKPSYLKAKQPILANALSILRKIDDHLAEAVLETIGELDLNNTEVAKYIPSIYYSIIEQGQIANQELKVKAFNSLTSTWSLSKEIKPNILQQLEFIHGFENEKRAFIVKAFADTDVEIAWIKNMHGLGEINTPDFLFELIQVASLRSQPQFDANVFEHLVDDLARKDDGKFSENLIQLMIHDNGFVRFAGSRIYTHLTFGRRNFHFNFDILLLTEIEQFKIIIATLTEVNPPQDTLSNILKLLDSSHDRVVVFLIGKLKNMVESYFDSVNKEMKSGLENHLFANSNAIKIIKEHYEKFIKHIEEKEAINELNPWHNEYPLMKYYSELHQRRQSRMMSEATNKNSFLSHIATTVNLAKGGGWKIEGRDDVQQLSNFSSSAPFPRVYFIAPEYLDRTISNKYFVTWKQIFQWERIQL